MRRAGAAGWIVAAACWCGAAHGQPGAPSQAASGAPSQAAPGAPSQAASGGPSQAVSGAPSQTPEPAETQSKDVAAETFVARCSGCHTIGGGNLGGPDLLPSTQWPDAQLRGAIKLMEKRVGPLENEEVGRLAELLRDPSARERVIAAQQAARRELESNLERPSRTQGMALFTGRKPLANGGLPCMTCHEAGGEGGSLGPELSTFSERVQGQALITAVQNASFNVMRASYREHPITQQEAIHIAAWLESLQDQPRAAAATLVPAAGVASGTLAFLALAFGVRSRTGARARLVRRTSRK